MPGIDRFMKRIASKDVAVYWGTPTVAGDGSHTYADPVEIDVLWKGKEDVMSRKETEEGVGRAVVYVTQDLDEQGMLYHGTLADLTSAQKADPRKVKKAFKITRFFKVPSMHLKGQFNRVVYINMF